MKSKALVLGVFGLFWATGAIYFDEWWHAVIGRESVWIPPHLVTSVGVFVNLLGFLLQTLERWRQRAPWEAPLKAWCLGLILVFLSVPATHLDDFVDGISERVFGRDLWAPIDLSLLVGMILIAIALLMSLSREREGAPDGFISVPILLSFAAVNGISLLLFMPFSPVHWDRILWPLGAFTFYYVLVACRIAALWLFQRPVLTYLSAIDWFFLSFLLLPDVILGRIETFGLLVLVMTGVLAGAVGDGAFVLLRRVEGRLYYPAVGLAYMAAASLLVQPFFNHLAASGHYEFDFASTLLALTAGGLAGYWGGPQIARWLCRSPIPREDRGPAIETGRSHLNIVMGALILVFIAVLTTLWNPAILESDRPRLSGLENPIGQIPSSLTFEKSRPLSHAFAPIYSAPSLWVSPDGRHAAYNAVKENKWVVVVDGVEGREYDSIKRNGKFSPDGKRFMYEAIQDGKIVLVLDGKESQADEGVHHPLSYSFSPDGRRTAFMAIRGREPGKLKFTAVIDGTEGPEYDEAGLYPNHFNPDQYTMIYNMTSDGRHLMVAAMVNRGLAMSDGPDRVFDIMSIGFSPDSRHYAYSAKREGAWKVVLDGIERGDYEAVVPFGGLDRSLYFSPDGKRFAYAAERGGKWFAVIDGMEGAQYDFVEGLFGGRFSPDGRRVTYTAMKGGKWAVVMDGVEGKWYDRVGPPYFSPDGQKIAYFAYEKGQEFLVLHGAEVLQGPASWTAFPHLIFSPDGQRIAYAKPGWPRWTMVVDGRVSGEYHTMSNPRFSPDSRHVAYAAALGTRWRVVIDGVEGKVYDAVSGLRFDSPAQVSYFAIDGRSIMRVEHRLDSVADKPAGEK